jgi:NDP-sugar pyrophosphorylase family protein
MSAFDQNMKLIFIRENKDLLHTNGCNSLRLASCSEPLASITFGSLNGDLNKGLLGTRGNSCPQSNNNIIAIPQDWAAKTGSSFAGDPISQKANVMYYKETLPIPSGLTSRLKANPWVVVANGRFATQTDPQWLYKILTKLQADVVAVNVMPQLQATHEKVLTTPQSKLVGFRLFYKDSAQLAPIPDDWPHYVFIKTDILGKLLVDDALPLTFPKFINICLSKSLTVRSLNIGGTVMNLDTEQGLLGLVATKLNSSTWGHPNANNNSQKRFLDKESNTISASARLFGRILLGKNVSISQNAIIVGPTIIGNDVQIAQGAVIRASVISPGVSVPQNCLIQNRVIIGSVPKREATRLGNSTNAEISYKNSCANNFRTWPRFSYARCVKRTADTISSLVVLILFAPIFPLIALAIR